MPVVPLVPVVPALVRETVPPTSVILLEISIGPAVDPPSVIVLLPDPVAVIALVINRLPVPLWEIVVPPVVPAMLMTLLVVSPAPV